MKKIKVFIFVSLVAILLAGNVNTANAQVKKFIIVNTLINAQKAAAEKKAAADKAAAEKVVVAQKAAALKAATDAFEANKKAVILLKRMPAKKSTQVILRQ